MCNKNVKPLSYFLFRSKSLSLYRDLLRTIKKVPNEDYRNELRQIVREDFEKYKHHTDSEIIKYHLSRGRSFHHELLSSLGQP